MDQHTKVKNIPLGPQAIIDEDDYREISKYKWHLDSNGYAVRSEAIIDRHKNIKMHRQIMGLGNTEEIKRK